MNDTLTINIPRCQLLSFMDESPAFRKFVADTFVQQITDVISELKDLLKVKFDWDSRIAAIKFVRTEWLATNGNRLTAEQYTELKSLQGAKKIVDEVIPYREWNPLPTSELNTKDDDFNKLNELFEKMNKKVCKYSPPAV
jgi:hypothetical protein